MPYRITKLQPVDMGMGFGRTYEGLEGRQRLALTEDWYRARGWGPSETIIVAALPEPSRPVLLDGHAPHTVTGLMSLHHHARGRAWSSFPRSVNTRERAGVEIG